MKILLSLVITVAALNASADQYKTVTKDLSSKNYQSSISYPEFNASSIPAYVAINANLVNTLISYGCDVEEAATSEFGQDYNASATVVALNQNYVGIEVIDESYCGGAHPNSSSYNVTYNSKTGAFLNMSEEFPQQDFSVDNVDWDKLSAFQATLAKIMYKYRKLDKSADPSCFENQSKKEYIDQLASLSPAISGLAKGKTVVIKTFPPHVAAVCTSSVRVPYSEIKSFLKKDSILHTWLK
jgi:hypothetical protein